MELEQRKEAFLKLGERIKQLPEQDFEAIVHSAYIYNRWFTRENIILAFNSISENLKEEKLNTWLKQYDFSETHPQTVGVIAAGRTYPALKNE